MDGGAMDGILKLRIGDIVYLNLEENVQGGWLCAEGHLGDNVFLSTNPEDFHYGLWEVHVQNQYSSFNEYEDAINSHRSRDIEEFLEDEEDDVAMYLGDSSTTETSEDSAVDTQGQEMLRQLRRAALNEQKLNERAMSTKIGTPVTFGDVVQLRHIASRKFLTVSTSQLAKQERENMRVLNVRNGNPYSAVVFAPRTMSIMNSRSQISNNCEIFIRIHERPGEYLRGAKVLSSTNKQGSKSQTEEVVRGEANCSLEKTLWSINVYQPVKDFSYTKAINAGRLVCLSDSLTRSHLTVQSSTFKDVTVTDTIDSLTKTKSSNLLISKEPQAVLRPRIGENPVNDLWRLEKRTITRGGAIRLSNDFVVFVHLSTNLYLHCRTTDGALMLVADRNRATEFDLRVNSQNQSTSLHQDSELLEDNSEITLSTISEFGKKVGLGSSPLYLSVNTKKVKAATEMIIQPDASTALSITVTNTTQSNLGSDIYFGIETNRCLENFRQLAYAVEASDAFDSPRMVAASQSFQIALQCLSQVVSWLMYVDGNTRNDETKADDAFGLAPRTPESRIARQTMMREQGVLNIIVELLMDCLDDKFNVLKLAATSTQERRTIPVPKAAEEAPTSHSRKMSANKDSSGSASARRYDSDSDDELNEAPKLGMVGRIMSTVGRSSFKNGTESKKERKSVVQSLTDWVMPARSGSPTVTKKKMKAPPKKKPKRDKGSDSDSDASSRSSSSSSSSSSTSSSSDDDDDFNCNTGTSDVSPKQPEKTTVTITHENVKTTSRRMSNVTSASGPGIGNAKAGVRKASTIALGSDGRLELPNDMMGRSLVAGRSEDRFNRFSKKSTVSSELAEALLQAIALCIFNHNENQLHISEFMPVLLKHVDSQEYAVYCLQELFKDNQTILQTKIRQIEINIFVSLLSKSEMNVPFLKLLQSTCTCPHGVDSTQRMVAVALFGSQTEQESSDQSVMTIKMFSDEHVSTNQQCIWVRPNSYSYIPSKSSSNLNENEILGFKLLTNGLPETFVNWNSNNPSKSMLKLFGMPGQIPFHMISKSYQKKFSAYIRMKYVSDNTRSRVAKVAEASRRASSAVTSLEKAMDKHDAVTKKGLRATLHMRKRDMQELAQMSPLDEYKCVVAEYLLTELYLVADLCLDRNYVAIQILEPAFPYDMLLTELRNPNVQSAFKAPICRILRCLWIDREPQTEAVFPRLIRSSKSDVENQRGFTKHHKGSPHSFCLLQQTISNYFHSGHQYEFGEFSREISELTLMLMRFGFYSHAEHLRDITTPLIRILDYNDILRIDADSIGERRNRNLASSDSMKDDHNVAGRDFFHISSSGKSIGDPTLSDMSDLGDSEEVQTKGFFERINSYLPWATRDYNRISPSNGGSKRVLHSEVSKPATSKPGYKYTQEDMEENEMIDNRSTYRTHRQMEAQKRKKNSHTNNLFMWESKYLHWSDSMQGLTIVMSVVVLTVTVSMMQIFPQESTSTPSFKSIFKNIDYFCSIFFMIELFLRTYCVGRTQGVRSGALLSYFYNPLNFVDLILVILDIVLWIIGSDGNAGIGAARASKAVKSVRFARLLRVVRVVRIVNYLKAKANIAIEWEPPERYTEKDADKFKTLTTIIQTLRVVCNRIQDNSLEIIINAFQAWVEETKEGSEVDPVTVIKKLLGKDQGMNLIPRNFENVLADVIMYDDAALCNEALSLLMIHLNKHSILLNLAMDIQIIYSPKVEAKLAEAKTLLQDMRRSAEMYEIWQNLELTENDLKAQKLAEMIKTLSNMLRKPENDITLAIKEEFIPDEEVQHLLRNLGAMNTFMIVLEALYDGGREELSPSIKKIMRSCMNMICYFVQHNERNQELAYEHFKFFVDTVDLEINSSSVLEAVLRGNPGVAKKCHKKYVEEFAQRIFTHGQKHEYMSFFLAMTDTSHTSDVGMKSVQNNISRFLTSREWQPRILLWCCGPDSNAYAQRTYAMSQYPDSDGKSVPQEELSQDLQYHILLLHVLAQCNLGPKLQAIYQLDDLVHAIIDKHTIFYVRIALGRCLEQLICNGADNFVCSEYMWLFFDEFVDYLDKLNTDLHGLLRRPISTSVVNKKKQIGQWLEICLTIITIFFAVLDLTIFGEIVDHDLSVKRTQRTENDVQNLIKKMYGSLRTFTDKHGFNLGSFLMERCNFALVAICRHSPSINFDPSANAGRMMTKKARGSVTLADVQQLQLRHKFIEFTTKLHENDNHNHEESIAFFLSIPSVTDTRTDVDVRIEPFVAKLVSHIRECIQVNQNSRILLSNYAETLWLLRTLRRLFEKHLGVSVEVSIDIDMTAVVNDSKTQFWRNTFNECGVTDLCLDLISTGIENSLTLEAINLLIVLLAERNGNSDVQKRIYNYLKNKDSTFFFIRVKELLGELSLWYQKEAENVQVLESENHEAVMVLPDENSIFTLLQLMCEGEYLPLKGFMREQEDNIQQVCLPSILASILDFLSRRESQLFTHVTIYVVKTLKVMLHGPCRENQKFIIMNTEVLVSLNRLIRLSRPKTQAVTSAWNLDIETLKECIIDTLRSMVEGFFKESIVFDRLMSSIEFNVLSLLLMPGEEDEEDVIEFGFTSMERKYLVLLHSLENPAYMDGLHKAVAVKASEVVRYVEVRWQGNIHRIHFQKPKIIEDLSKDYMTRLEENEGASQEEKMVDFLGGIKALYIEAKHQQLLKTYGISYLWSRKLYFSWLMFILSATLNIMLLAYYHRNAASEIHLGGEEEDDVKAVIAIITFSEVVLSLMMTLLYFTVRMPANFLSNVETGHTKLQSAIITMLDPLPWWYMIFFFCAIESYVSDPIWSVVFMLEWIVLDGTTQQLLKAVYYPFWQLVATLTILIIVIHIFSAMYFSLCEPDMLSNHVEPVYDLWNALKLALSYGLRGEYGLDHEFDTTLNARVILDLTFYFIVLAILRHIFFAIIVETFGQLREMKNERDELAHNSCFICGIHRHDFEKAGVDMTFHQHRSQVHSVENYVHFVFAVLDQHEWEDLGIESYVRKCVKQMDISWIPIGLDSFFASINRSEGKKIKQDEVVKRQQMLSLVRQDDHPGGKESHHRGKDESFTDTNEDDKSATGTESPRVELSEANAQSINDLIRAVQGISQSINTIGSRVKELEEKGSSSMSAGDGGYQMQRVASRDMTSFRAPVPSSTQLRSQLRGPSEQSVERHIPSLHHGHTISSIASVNIRSHRASFPTDDETKHEP